MEQNRKVKFMKKKLSLILCLCFMALGLAACGTDPTTVDYFGMTYDELQSSMEQEVSALVGLTDDNRTYIQSYGSDTAMKLVESWDEATSDVGAYQGLGEFNITKAQKTLTVDQYVEYQNREVIVSYIYTYNYETEQPELTDASADKVYTLGEKMEKAASELNFEAAAEYRDKLIELKNMLMYMKINYGLKIRLSELTEVAVALYQALQLSEQPVRIKELYTRLRGFEKEKLLDKDSCYELLGTKKPESAKEQLDALKTYRDGIKAYTNGVKKASDGSSKLKEGTDQLEEGTKELMKAFDMETSNLTQFLKADDNIRIGAAAGDQVISKLAGMVAGVIIMILFTYVISVFVIHEIEKENSIIGTLYALGVIKKQLKILFDSSGDRNIFGWISRNDHWI